MDETISVSDTQTDYLAVPIYWTCIFGFAPSMCESIRFAGEVLQLQVRSAPFALLCAHGVCRPIAPLYSCRAGQVSPRRSALALPGNTGCTGMLSYRVLTIVIYRVLFTIGAYQSHKCMPVASKQSQRSKWYIPVSLKSELAPHMHLAYN